MIITERTDSTFYDAIILDFREKNGNSMNMKPFFAFFIVFVIALVGYHFSFRRLGAGAGSRLRLTGLEFLAFGLVLGPGFLNVIDEHTAKSLEPLTALVMGWLGLLFGFQFEVFKLRRLPRACFPAALVESMFTFVFVFFGVFFMLPDGFFFPTGLLCAIVLSAAAACSAQTGLALAQAGAGPDRSGLIRTLRYIAGVDGLFPMLILCVAHVFSAWSHGAGALGAGAVLIPAFAGLVVLYFLLLARRRQANELALVIIGMTLLVSGAAAMAGFSPLAANFILGVCIVNITREKEKIFNLLVSIEKPAYILLLLFFGAAWQVTGVSMLLPAVLYAVFRFAGKMAGGFTVTALLKPLRAHPRSFGLGLLELGGLPVVILYDFQQSVPGQGVATVVGIALAAIVVNDLVSLFMLTGLVPRNGETKI
ncbi:MAG: hypothetical protein GXP53_11275 [Deltaproteobacteria bacterium]|nr:hypothetical protein [Deltaproteobacteria bacterium]